MRSVACSTPQRRPYLRFGRGLDGETASVVTTNVSAIYRLKRSSDASSSSTQRATMRSRRP